MPPLFRGQPTVIKITNGVYKNADVLSDLFIEDIRLQSKRYDQTMSILEQWTNPVTLQTNILQKALKTPLITPESLRDTIYREIPETKTFSISAARTLLKTVLGNNLAHKKLLDISAGWGDRLLAAISLDMDYVGFDPNTNLRPGQNEMIKMFGDPNRHQIFYEPFETADIPQGPYDVILTSPPYFTIEEYVPGQKGQSIVSYPRYSEWMIWFLFVSLSKAWDHLKDNGYLILHLGDALTIKTAEATNIFIENNLVGASFEGIIGLQTTYPRPVWVWRKSANPIIWEPQGQAKQLPAFERTLFKTYPSLQIELIIYWATQLDPGYRQRRINAKAIRSNISVKYSDTPYINIILSDDLMISSLLENMEVDDVIKWGSDVITSAPDRTLELLTNFVSNNAPYYDVRKHNAKNVRNQVATALPEISKDSIDRLLSDNLLIASLLEIFTLEEVINWCITVVNKSHHRIQ